MEESPIGIKTQKHNHDTHCFLRIHAYLGDVWEQIDAEKASQGIIKFHVRTKENIDIVRKAFNSTVKEIDRTFPGIKNRTKTEEDCVYIVRAVGTNYYKIGHTSRPIRHRLSELQNGNPLDLVLVASWSADEEAEREMHSLFAPYHTRGEWFELSAAEVLPCISEITALID